VDTTVRHFHPNLVFPVKTKYLPDSSARLHQQDVPTNLQKMKKKKKLIFDEFQQKIGV